MSILRTNCYTKYIYKSIIIMVDKFIVFKDNAGRIMAMEAALPYLEMLRMLEQAFIQVGGSMEARC